MHTKSAATTGYSGIRAQASGVWPVAITRATSVAVARVCWSGDCASISTCSTMAFRSFSVRALRAVCSRCCGARRVNPNPRPTRSSRVPSVEPVAPACAVRGMPTLSPARGAAGPATIARDSRRCISAVDSVSIPAATAGGTGPHSIAVDGCGRASTPPSSRLPIDKVSACASACPVGVQSRIDSALADRLPTSAASRPRNAANAQSAASRSAIGASRMRLSRVGAPIAAATGKRARKARDSNCTSDPSNARAIAGGSFASSRASARLISEWAASRSISSSAPGSGSRNVLIAEQTRSTRRSTAPSPRTANVYPQAVRNASTWAGGTPLGASASASRATVHSLGTALSRGRNLFLTLPIR